MIQGIQGYSFNEVNQSDKDRIIADAYGCVKKLLDKELEQVDLDYTITKNETTGCSDISFLSKDKNVRIFYKLDLGNLLEIPYKEINGKKQYEYSLGETIHLSDWRKMIVAAYAPGKEKKVLEFSAPTYTNECGYRLTESSKTQQYNKIDRCQFIDEKVIEVPETINGIEVQEIGDWCFIGNKTVEKIILPETVKQIDRYAFANCPNLKEVIAPGVEVCGMYAFSNCDNLVNVKMPNVTVANTGMFKNCSLLETAKLGTLTEIDNHAFYGCENLKLVKTTKDNISFAVNTFKDCDLLTLYTPSADTSIFKYGKENDIPVIISFNYKLTSIKNGKVTYKDADSDNTAAYKADNLRRMWDINYVNNGTDCEELAFLFELNDDNIINAKDFAILNKA